MKHRHRFSLLLIPGLAFLLAGLVDGAGEYGGSMRVGAAVYLLTIVGEWRLKRLPRSVEAAYLLGKADGHRDGYNEGRRARLAVVPFNGAQLAGSDGIPPVTDRRRPGSPMRTIVDRVTSDECNAVGVDSRN